MPIQLCCSPTSNINRKLSSPTIYHYHLPCETQAHLDSPFCIVITLTLVIVIMLAFSRAFAFFVALFSSLLLTARSCQFHGHGLNLSSIDYRSMVADNVSTRFLRRREISSTRVAVHNVRVFDGSVLLHPSTVVIDGGLICRPCTACEACPPTESYDARGMTLLPGLIDSHAHPVNISSLVNMTR